MSRSGKAIRSFLESATTHQHRPVPVPLSSSVKTDTQVTIDILDDSHRQNDSLDRTTNTFSAFTNSLFSTRSHHSRSMASQSLIRQYRIVAYVVGALVVLWVLSKVFRGAGGGGGGGAIHEGV
jgi:blocked-early-in-transport protein 1